MKSIVITNWKNSYRYRKHVNMRLLKVEANIYMVYTVSIFKNAFFYLFFFHYSKKYIKYSLCYSNVILQMILKEETSITSHLLNILFLLSQFYIFIHSMEKVFFCCGSFSVKASDSSPIHNFLRG